MIGRLRGILIEKIAPNVLLDVHGVCYEIILPLNAFALLPKVGTEVTIHTHYIVREDGHFLFGFLREPERALFRNLIKVNGVGPKIALAILSGIEPDLLVQNILQSDVASIERVPGIGKKLAQRLIIEMRDKLGEWNALGISGVALVDGNSEFVSSAQDAIGALISLGYRPHEARQAVMKHKDKPLSSEDLIRLALKDVK